MADVRFLSEPQQILAWPTAFAEAWALGCECLQSAHEGKKAELLRGLPQPSQQCIGVGRRCPDRWWIERRERLGGRLGDGR